MKMALTELMVFPSIPVKVTINEYIEISKSYSSIKSKLFINGILDKLIVKLKEEGRIRKTGRGLIE
jgi:N utilization substance protein B